MSISTPRTRAIARWQAKKSTPEQELQRYIAWRYGMELKVPKKAETSKEENVPVIGLRDSVRRPRCSNARERCSPGVSRMVLPAAATGI
jgi:hypothetical protein